MKQQNVFPVDSKGQLISSVKEKYDKDVQRISLSLLGKIYCPALI